MNKSTFKIHKMDCASEEQMIRMKLESLDEVKQLEFDIPHRQLQVYHSAEIDGIQNALAELQLNEKLVNTQEADLPEIVDHRQQRKVLW